jgi:Fe-S-cluster containining protein
MPKGKPAGVRCINLNATNLCTIFGKPERPEVCNNFMPAPDTCGETNKEAMQLLSLMESATSPTEDRNY